MKTVACLGLAIAIGTCSSLAQEAPGPLPAAPAPHSISFTAARAALHEFPIPAASERSGVMAPRATPRTSRTADTKFFLLNGSFLGMAVFDVELTQHCIADHHCREQNPLMPSSHAGQLGLNLGLVAGASAATYWLKKHGSPLWWLPPATGIAVHATGVATGFQHQ